MKDTVGLLLRERWKEKGNPDCPHTELSQERSFSGTLTGAQICTTCGAFIDSRMPVKPEAGTTFSDPA